MTVYYEDRFLRPRREAVPRRTQRNLARWRRAWVPRVDPGTDPNPEVSGFHAYKAWNMSCSTLPLCFWQGMIGHDRVGYRSCFLAC